jgi:predicted SAM-dependent methyltransferase
MKLKTRVAYAVLPSHTWGQMRFDWSLNRRRLGNTERRARALLEGHERLHLHLGCGARACSGWVNIDAFEQPGLDLRWDLRDPLPCADGSATLIYSEHVLEHLEYEDARRVLKELYRLLAPDGRLRLGVPDAELYMRAYAAGDHRFFDKLRNIGNPATPLDTPVKVINQMFRMGGAHRFAWDFQTLAQQLQEAGFQVVERWSPGQASRPELCLDDPMHADETLYVEAAKGHSSLHG